MRTTDHRFPPAPDLSWVDDYYEGRSRGRRAYFDLGLPLEGNPFDPGAQPHTHRGWRDGWLEAQYRVRVMSTTP